MFSHTIVQGNQSLQGGKLDYKEKLRQINKEAKTTLIVFVLLAIWWFATGFGLKGVSTTLFGLPLWVILSTWVTWILSCIAVVFLVKKVFKNFDLKG